MRFLLAVALVVMLSGCAQVTPDPAPVPTAVRVDDGRLDSDADGLADEDEVAQGTDPQDPDSDNDGLDDKEEAEQGTDPVEPDSDADGVPDGAEVENGTDPLGPVVDVKITTTMSFTESVVDAAVSYFNDLYEPTMDVSDNGAIFITGHTILVDTTGAPVFGSWDDGRTWEQLPWVQDVSMPADLPGATPPPSDEIFLVAGDDGWLYGVDITLATFPVNMWNDDGHHFAFHNPNGYDESRIADCFGLPVKDRPWAAYANGTLLMVNNPAGGRAQVGVMDVPPVLPVGAGGLSMGAEWNLCAGPGGSIPGIPDIREDGLFAVPQMNQGALTLTMGNAADVGQVETVRVFPNSNQDFITSHYGQAVFDAEGTMFVGAGNNTDHGGRFQIALSTDGGRTFQTRAFNTGQDLPVESFYMDGNFAGPGALVVWATPASGGGSDWYVGHAQAGAAGPIIRDAALAIPNGPKPSAHVTGSAVGPDGRAYLATFDGAILGTPLSVWVQQTGPAMPVMA